MNERPRLGKGGLSWPRRHSVFINCPYDDAFLPIFDAIVFSVVCCGFMPRCARETGSVSQPRLAQITAAMSSSKYSIHDLSRCQGEGDTNSARFNMPLELGMAMQQAGTGAKAEHDWLVLMPEGHDYHKVVSDLAGHDPAVYEGTAESVIPAVMAWMATRPDALPVPTPVEVLESVPLFVRERTGLRDAWRGREPWAEVVRVALAVGEVAELVPRDQRRRSHEPKVVRSDVSTQPTRTA